MDGHPSGAQEIVPVVMDSPREAYSLSLAQRGGQLANYAGWTVRRGAVIPLLIGGGPVIWWTLVPLSGGLLHGTDRRRECVVRRLGDNGPTGVSTLTMSVPRNE